MTVVVLLFLSYMDVRNLNIIIFFIMYVYDGYICMYIYRTGLLYKTIKPVIKNSELLRNCQQNLEEIVCKLQFSTAPSIYSKVFSDFEI